MCVQEKCVTEGLTRETHTAEKWMVSVVDMRQSNENTLDWSGIEPETFRMQSECDTPTPSALEVWSCDAVVTYWGWVGKAI